MSDDTLRSAIILAAFAAVFWLAMFGMAGIPLL